MRSRTSCGRSKRFVLRWATRAILHSRLESETFLDAKTKTKTSMLCVLAVELHGRCVGKLADEVAEGY